MNLLALAIATPLFGFSLQLDPTLAVTSRIALDVAASEIALEAVTAPALDAPDTTSDAAPTEPGATSEVTPTESGATSEAAPSTPANLTPAGAASTSAAAPTHPPSDVAAQLTRRARIARIHRALGLSTWASMTVTVMLGIFQYYNLYGFFASQGNAPCVTGREIGRSSSCLGTPGPHLAFAGLTSTLYFSTFGLSFAMPDPKHLDRGNTPFARRLRQHKRLRWAHFSGMIAQILLGVISANGTHFGLDRANDYRALQGLATAHLLVGLSTYATLTWAGAIMIKRR